MTRNDEHILEYMEREDATLSPMSLGGPPALELEGSDLPALFRRLPILLAAGLVEETDDGHYAISARGRAYLRGDLDEADFEDQPADRARCVSHAGQNSR
jgi:hypothetical protein